MAKFTVTLTVPTALLGPVIEVLNPQVKVESIVPYRHAPEVAKVHHHKKNYPARKHHGAGRTGMDIVMAMLGDKPTSSADLMKAFIADNRAANSVSPLTSSLQADGRIKLNGDGKWELAR